MYKFMIKVQNSFLPSGQSSFSSKSEIQVPIDKHLCTTVSL